MGSVVDVGIPGNTLDNPPLTEWQKAVRDALNSEDTTVNDRLDALEADVKMYVDQQITISDQLPSGVPARDDLIWIVVY